MVHILVFCVLLKMIQSSYLTACNDLYQSMIGTVSYFHTMMKLTSTIWMLSILLSIPVDAEITVERFKTSAETMHQRWISTGRITNGFDFVAYVQNRDLLDNNDDFEGHCGTPTHMLLGKYWRYTRGMGVRNFLRDQDWEVRAYDQGEK